MFGFVLCTINKHCNVILLFLIFISAVNTDSVMMYKYSGIAMEDCDIRSVLLGNKIILRNSMV